VEGPQDAYGNALVPCSYNQIGNRQEAGINGEVITYTRDAGDLKGNRSQRTFVNAGK
jgi:hypothetical protein